MRASALGLSLRFLGIAAALAVVDGCSDLSIGSDAAGGSPGTGGAGPCENGVKDGGEADVDCGAACAIQCGQGKACAQNADCRSDRCEMGRCLAKPGSSVWVKTAGETGDNQGKGVGVDIDGNVYVTGHFTKIINLGGEDLVTADPYASDIFIAKYTPDGGHLWSKRLSGSHRDYGPSIAFDPSGNVLVTGQFEGLGNFGGDSFLSNGPGDVFVVKLDANGNHVWSKAYGGDGSDAGYSIAVDGAGNVYLSGVYEGFVDFGGGELPPSVFEDQFLLKLDSAGNHLWSKGYYGSQRAFPSAIDVDTAGNIYAAGYFEENAEFGGDPFMSAGAGSSDRRDIYLAKYDTMGKHLWSKTFGGPKNDAAVSIAVDKVSGDAFVAGVFESPTLSLGGADLVNKGAYDAFIAKVDGSGSHVWSKSFGSAAGDEGLAVTFDGLETLYLAGRFHDSVDFGGGPLGAQGPHSAFVAAYDAMGAHRWSQRWGGEGDMTPLSIDINGSGDLYTTGAFYGTVDFGEGPVTASGDHDYFLLKVGEDPPAPP